MIQTQAQKGFTLIEVLLAMAITVIVAAMSFQALDSAMRLAESEEAESDNIQRTNRVLDILAKDFRQIVPRMVRDATGNGFEDAFYYNSTSSPMLAFSRNGWTNPQPARFQRSQLQRVYYHYDGDKLVRTSYQMMDRQPDSEPVEITLMENVRSFEVRLLANTGSSSGGGVPGVGGTTTTNGVKATQWVNIWPSNQGQSLSATGSYEATNALPMAIEIEMDIDKWGKLRRVFEIPGDD